MAEAVRVVVAGEAQGEVLALDEPLSFWGGFESATGTVIDQSHPQVGANLAAMVVTMATGRGSSSASTVLAEAIRRGTAPAALIMLEVDEIIALGAIVAQEMYGIVMPIVIVDEATLGMVNRAHTVGVHLDGKLTLIS